MSDIAAEIPGFEALSLVRWSETRRNGYDSEGSQDWDDKAVARYDDLKHQAPVIVRQLCERWTGLDQDSLQGHARISAHPLARDMSGDDNLKSGLGNANEAEPTRPPKLRGLSLYDANQDEPPARFSSYPHGAARRDDGGANPVGKSSQRSPLLREQENESKWDPFSSILPERSKYSYRTSEGMPESRISPERRSFKAKEWAFGGSTGSDRKQDSSRRWKNTMNESDDEFDLHEQPDIADPLEEGDFSDHRTSGPAPGRPSRRSAQQPTKSPSSQQEQGFSSDQVESEGPLRPASPEEVSPLKFSHPEMHFSHVKGHGLDTIYLYPPGGRDSGASLGYVKLKFKSNSIRDGTLKVADVCEASRNVAQMGPNFVLNLVYDRSFPCKPNKYGPLNHLNDHWHAESASSAGLKSGAYIECRASTRQDPKRLWSHMKSMARALKYEYVAQ